jgi:hypothetical protein
MKVPVLEEVDLLGGEKASIPKVQVTNKDSKWRMSSAFQKAIRRGHDSVAMDMLAGLLQVDVWYPFRRVGVIALEDVGLANLDLVKLATQFAHVKQVTPLAQEKLAEVVLAMCWSPKSRAVCEATYMAATDPAVRDQFTRQKETDDLGELPLVPLHAAAARLWGAAGTKVLPHDDVPQNLGTSKKQVERVLDEMALPQEERQFVEYLLTRTGMSGMGPALAAVLFHTGGELPDPKKTKDDFEPPWEVLHNYPSYAFDQFCFEGKRAFAYLYAMDEEIKQWMFDLGFHEKKQAVQLLTELWFWVESGVLKKRVDWHLEGVLHEGSVQASFRHTKLAQAPSNIPFVLNALRSKIDKLNYARAKILAKSS